MIMKKQKRNWLLSNMDQRDDDDNSQTCRGTYPVFTLVNDA